MAKLVFLCVCAGVVSGGGAIEQIISGIEVWHGSCINALQIYYSDEDSEAVVGKSLPGDAVTRFHFDPGEVMTSIISRGADACCSGTLGGAIEVATNKRDKNYKVETPWKGCGLGLDVKYNLQPGGIRFEINVGRGTYRTADGQQIYVGRREGLDTFDRWVIQHVGGGVQCAANENSSVCPDAVAAWNCWNGRAYVDDENVTIVARTPCVPTDNAQEVQIEAGYRIGKGPSKGLMDMKQVPACVGGDRRCWFAGAGCPVNLGTQCLRSNGIYEEHGFVPLLLLSTEIQCCQVCGPGEYADMITGKCATCGILSRPSTYRITCDTDQTMAVVSIVGVLVSLCVLGGHSVVGGPPIFLRLLDKLVGRTLLVTFFPSLYFSCSDCGWQFAAYQESFQQPSICRRCNERRPP